MKHYLLRLRIELFERIKLFSKEEKTSINKMIIKLIEIGIITYIRRGVNLYEDDIKQVDC
ncbi:MAG: hypothetical protein E7162_01670 [Firmicutes bacterium]|nr:hypothetical protein [Bacillota bacterium]